VRTASRFPEEPLNHPGIVFHFGAGAFMPV
jgi:hypothetical protein